MNTRQMKKEEVALLIMGLETIYVHEQEALRQKMLDQLRGELASRGLKLAEENA